VRSIKIVLKLNEEPLFPLKEGVRLLVEYSDPKHIGQFEARATALIADLRKHGDKALIDQLKTQLVDMDSGACPHARFVKTLIKNLDD
jgi:hypothetical protein